VIEQSGNALVGALLGRFIIPVSFRVRWDIDRNYIVQKRRHSLRRNVSITSDNCLTHRIFNFVDVGTPTVQPGPQGMT